MCGLLFYILMAFVQLYWMHFHDNQRKGISMKKRERIQQKLGIQGVLTRMILNQILYHHIKPRKNFQSIFNKIWMLGFKFKTKFAVKIYQTQLINFQHQRKSIFCLAQSQNLYTYKNIFCRNLFQIVQNAGRL
ncbi:unnamed protein product [Paramecium sonneborni]|uniref:Transmembrane protein n=1 Tax=Paramecium sonneborni TaxID=65129 RepID=A0A8S1RBE1_9CILI|nr:unnamed protein product [Paramecium sonneborni]